GAEGEAGEVQRVAIVVKASVVSNKRLVGVSRERLRGDRRAGLTRVVAVEAHGEAGDRPRAGPIEKLAFEGHAVDDRCGRQGEVVVDRGEVAEAARVVLAGKGTAGLVVHLRPERIGLRRARRK